jgi:hypothetical protein
VILAAPRAEDIEQWIAEAEGTDEAW